jgi:hypothetical protein
MGVDADCAITVPNESESASKSSESDMPAVAALAFKRR